MSKVYVGAAGVGVELDTTLAPQILAGATNQTIEALFPDGTTTQSWAASIVPSTGHIRYVTTGSEITQAGIYKLQAKLTFGSQIVRGDTVNWQIFANFS